MWQGQYVVHPDTDREEILPNTIVEDGSSNFLKLIFQQIDNLPGGNFYLGLTNAAYAFDTATLANLAVGEPVGNGYARQAVARSNVGWDVSKVNGLYRARSLMVTFTASGNWDKVWDKLFLCDANAGTAGMVFSVSKQRTTPETVLAGAGPSVVYEFWDRY